MKKIKIFLLLFIIHLTTFNLAVADRYVSTQGTDPAVPDIGCCSDPQNPCRTINLAIKWSGIGNNVLVAKGIYTGEYIGIVNVIGNKTIQGGWNESFTEKISDPSLTVIQGKNTEDYVFDIIGSNRIDDLVIDNFTIINPTVSSAGTSGVNVRALDAYVLNLTLRNLILQEAGYAGVNLWSINNGVANVVIENSIICNNSSVGIRSAASGFAPNYYPSTIDLDIKNCTISNNPYGIILHASYEGELTVNIKNSILWGQETYDVLLRIIDVSGYSPEITASTSYCDIGTVYNMEGGTYTEGPGGIHQDPLFVNASNENYHIKTGSPCRNKGIYGKKVFAGGFWFVTNYNIPENDFEGDSRNSEWIESPTNTFYKYCDIGADEFKFTNTYLPCIPLLLLND